MAKTVQLQPGERTKVFSRTMSSIPRDYQFSARALDGSPIVGTVEVQGSNWLFPKPVETQPLQAQNTVHAGYWDTLFHVWVSAESPTEITIQHTSSPIKFWVILLAALVIVGIGGALLLVLLL